MATFITKLDFLSETELSVISTMEKSDNLIILSGSDGNIPIKLYPLLTGLKCKNEIIITDFDSSPEAMAFSLGVLCSEAGNSIVLVLPEQDPLSTLNGCTFKSSKGEFIVRVCSNFKDACKSRGSSDNKPRATRTRRKSKEETDKKVESDFVPVAAETVIDTNDEDAGYLGAEPTAAFVECLKKIETPDMPLATQAKEIQECVIRAYDGVLTFKFQIELRCGKAKAEKIYSLLESHYLELKKYVNVKEV